MELKGKKQPKHYDAANLHVLFFSGCTVSFVYQAVLNPAIPIVSKIFCSLFFLAIPYLLLKWDFNNMVQRRLFIESFFEETETDDR